MGKQFKIYAAPRAEDGRYRFTSTQSIYIKEFCNQEEMLQYWQQVILPDSSSQFGLRYELSMTEFAGADWDFIGDPRYADQPLLKNQQHVSVDPADGNAEDAVHRVINGS